MDLCNINEIKALLARHGFHFSKAKGQNFLTQSWVPREIVLDARIDDTCGVLEVGPGIGPLTQQLCRSAKKVVAVEVDRSLQPVLAETMAGNENLTILFADILKTDIKALVEEEFSGLRPMACANLPYYITTPIIMGLFESHVPLKSITIMVQKEVAQRMQVGPGTKDYGALSLAVQYYAKPEIVATVSPECFIPKPNVGSAVIRLTCHDKPPVTVPDERFLFDVIRASFQQRRKTLTNSLSHAGLPGITREAVEQALLEMELSPSIRGEALSLEEFAALSSILYTNRK